MNGIKYGQKKMKKPGKSFLSQILHNWQLYIMTLPALIYLIVIVYKPMYGIMIAFKDYSFRKGIVGSPWVGFDNFERLFSSYWFPIIIKNTLLISIITLILSFPVPIILALLVNEIRNEKIKRTFQTVSYAPYFISTVVICGMITLFLSPSSGIINKLLNLAGLESVLFMQKPGMFKWIYVISGIWQGTGWGAVIYFAALSGVDKQLLEAADIDGASRLKKILHITLPVLIPTIVVLFVLQCGNLLSVGYEKVYLLQNSANLGGSEVISTYVYKIGLEQNDFSFSTATNLFNSLINGMILIAANVMSKQIGKVSLW